MHFLASQNSVHENSAGFDTHVAQNGIAVLQSTRYMLAQGRAQKQNA